MMTNVNKLNNEASIANSIHSPKFKKHPHSNQNVVDKEINKAENLKELMVNHKSSISAKLVLQSISAHLSFTSYSTSSSQKSVYQELANVDLQKAEKESDANSLFDFELVAENVMSFISQSIMTAKENGANEQKLSTMFEQARKGVDIGVGDALKELEEMTILDDELSQGIAKSQELIHQGIDKLSENILNGNDDGVEKEFLDNSISQSFNSSDLSIVTADGDNVVIKFEQLMANQQSRYIGDNKSIEQQFSYQEVNFSFEVQGELDDQERQSIEQLVSDVAKLQKDFFSGDITSALEKAQELNFNTEEISSLNLQLSMINSNVASRKYTDVANIADKEKAEEKQVIANKIKPVIDFVEQFKKIEERAEKLFSKDYSQIKQFYDGILKAGLVANNEETTNSMLTKWHEVVDNLISNTEQ